MALAVCPLCPGGRRLAAYQSRILQAVAQSIGDYRIGPINQCRDVLLAPQQTPNVTFLCPLQHETHAGIVALALHAPHAPTTARESVPVWLAPGTRD